MGNIGPTRKPILDYLQAMHESTNIIVAFNLDKDGAFYNMFL